jgi:hypothetical protein
MNLHCQSALIIEKSLAITHFELLNLRRTQVYCQNSRFWQELLTQEKLEIALKEPIKCSKY